MDLKEEEAIGAAIDSHWYYTSKARMMADHVKRLSGATPLDRVIDVGAGAGWFSRWMLRQGHAAQALCVDPGYDREWDEKEAGRDILFRRTLEGETGDLILMMDVLEHVEDDVGLLAHYLDAVPAGTPVFITVPAFEMLWSAHDDYLEHYRRYTLDRLRGVIKAAGATPHNMHYFFGAIFPAVAAVRWLSKGRDATQSDMRPTPEPLNGILKGVCAAEQYVMRFNRLAGVSAVACCWRAPK